VVHVLNYLLPGACRTPPFQVTSVNVVCVGAGGAGLTCEKGGGGGGGGALVYANNVPVFSGTPYQVYVGAPGNSTTPDGGKSGFKFSDQVWLWAGGGKGGCGQGADCGTGGTWSTAVFPDVGGGTGGRGGMMAVGSYTAAGTWSSTGKDQWPGGGGGAGGYGGE
jgi:hypothetical protein